MKNEGASVIEKAKEKINQLGQRNSQMTEISQKARELVEKLNEKLTNTQQVANSARNTSMDAYEILKEATQLQQNASDDVQHLEYKLQQLERKMNDTDDQIEKLRNHTLETNKKALDAFEEANSLTIPESLLRQSDFSLLSDDREKSEREAYRILNDTDKLVETMEDLRNTVQESLMKAEQILGNVRDQQELMDGLLSDVDTANSRAEDAIRACNKTLNDAQEMYDTLTEFDKQVCPKIKKKF